MPTSNQTVPVEEIIQKFISTNSAMIDNFVGLETKIENDITAAQTTLQGETEELLREILQLAAKAVEQVLVLQEQLQTRFVESYFPAQD